jgi:iron(III) transport system substrate-binding protein
MKTSKILALSMMLVLLPAMLFAGSGQDNASVRKAGSSDPNAALKQLIATDPSREELIKLAQAEGYLMVYTPSSRHSKVGQEFGLKYGIKVDTTQLGDGEMVEKVSKEAAANIDAADVVYCQDGGRVYAELIEPGYVFNYTPPSLRDIIPKEFQNPQVWDITTKQFIFNSEKSESQPFQNVWELTEPAWKGHVQFKDPFGEGVNMNFLTMVTKPEIASQVARAYRSRYGRDIVLTTPNAGYEWIKAFFGNGLVLGKSDTTMSEAIGAKGQSVQLAGLFTLNKVRTAQAKNLALKTATAMEPFTGFYYPIYCFIPSNSRSPNAAKLFIEYCLTEGYAAWNELGDYSPNPQNPNTEDPVPLSQWVQWLVGEDPKWCAENRADVEEFLNSIL